MMKDALLYLKPETLSGRNELRPYILKLYIKSA